jgi:putative endopeptidase
MTHVVRSPALVLGAMLLATIAPPPARVAAAAATTTERQQDFLRAHMDAAVDPGVDFFTYANGGWLARNPIPPTDSWWGIGKLVEAQLDARLRAINEQAAASAAPAGSEQRKIGDYWVTAMDASRADRLGRHPLDAELARIDAVHDVRSALDEAFALRALEVETFFKVGVSQDERDSGTMAVHLSQGGLGLPDRDFYFNPEPGVARIRREYVEHIARSLRLLGRNAAGTQAAAQDVMDLETALASAARKLEELNDPIRNYHRMSPAEVTARYTPTIQWGERLAAWSIRPEFVVVGQPEFYVRVELLLHRTPVAALRDYLRVRLLDAYADTLSRPFQAENFRFHGQALSGRKVQPPRWKRVLEAEDEAIGMLLGKAFVHEYFPPASRLRYVELVEAIRRAYRERIEKLDWMGPDTKAKAESKLAAITAKVGYPDKWKDYSALVIGRSSWCENAMNAARWRFNDEIGKYGKPADRTEWDMTPQTYNAYYSQNNNEIVLPAAAFMIPGLPDAQVDDAVIYGYVGAATIGHEITHGFDDSGRHYDAGGNLEDWWTAEDARQFEQRAAVLARQFDAYEPLPGLHINGQATLGENIADYGGVLLGLAAFRKTEQYRKGELVAGLTPVQRYFLGYALGWMMQEREERLRADLLSDVHAPARWRVNGPLSNIPDFYAAFGVRPGQPMWRAESGRAQIW